MKRLLTLLILVCNSPFIEAGELDTISIITPTSYIRPTSSTQTFKSRVKVGVGDLINTDVVAEVKSKINPYKKDLAAYFSTQGELDNFIDKIVIGGKNATLGNDLSDAKLIRFYEYLGNNLIGSLADKILNTEGVKDPARRTLWVNKILAPFKTCVAKAKNALYDANHCIDALTSSLVPSTGIGLVYELSRKSLSSSLPENQRQKFNTDQTLLYKSCMRVSAGEASDVKKCALEAMKAGVLKITDPKLSKTINESSSSAASAKSIKQSVWPVFNQCTEKVGGNPSNKAGLNVQFMDCIDSLVENTGFLLVQDKVSNNATIKSNFSNTEVGKLALDKAESFKECIVEQKKKNQRKDGMLDTTKCENSITNEITYKVVLKSLTETANDSFKDNLADRTKAATEGKKLLDACWNNDQSNQSRESCLRKTILSFSEVIATAKLDDAIPDDIKVKKTLTANALKDLKSCLEKNLPTNISEAKNLNAQTGLCSNRLTVSLAQKVAAESIRAKAAEQNMSETATNQLIKTLVDQKFMGCIGSSPSDDKLDACSGELKKNAAITLASSQIRANAEGKVTPAETDKLVASLVNQKFASCLGNNPSDAKLNDCVGDLTKSATRSIVLAYQKKQIKEQLNADFTPSKLKPVESDFIICTEKDYPADKVSKAMDECTKNFALGFARSLGELKLNSLMKSVLGTNGYDEQKTNLDAILGKYNECLNDLKKFSMEDGLLDKLNFCTDGLQRRGVNFVSSTVNTWMSSEQKDAATIMVKQEFANFIPCLSGLLPASPYSQQLQKNVDSALKPVAMLISQYIEYSPENAKRTLDEISRKLSSDLKDVASNPASRKEMIDMLYNNGALDQFLKSMVRAQVKQSFDAMPESDLPSELSSSLLSKENFDKIFASAEGKAIKDMVMDKILKPVLMEQASLKSPLMEAGMDSVKDRVVKMLVYSPNFGEEIIKTSVQNKINDMGGFTRFFAKAIYGKDALVWEKVRMTEKGKQAEEYIRANVLLPKFNGESKPADQEKRINEEAEKLVTAAVKSYE